MASSNYDVVLIHMHRICPSLQGGRWSSLVVVVIQLYVSYVSYVAQRWALLTPHLGVPGSNPAENFIFSRFGKFSILLELFNEIMSLCSSLSSPQYACAHLEIYVLPIFANAFRIIVANTLKKTTFVTILKTFLERFMSGIRTHALSYLRYST